MKHDPNAAEHRLYVASMEWIEQRPRGKTFHVSDLYKYVKSTFPDLCDAAGSVSSGELRETNTPRYALWESKKLGLVKNGARRGYWDRK
jgi:hypothetical protein